MSRENQAAHSRPPAKCDRAMPRLATEIKGDIRAARKIRLPWWALLCLGIGSFLAAWLFDRFGRLTLALPMLNSILVLGFTVAVRRKLRGRAWFWITMTVLAALHVPLILF